MRIAVDVDSTVADLGTHWLRMYNNEYDDDFKLEDWTTWDIHTLVKCGMDIYKYLRDPDLYDKLYPIANAQEAVWEMQKDHRVIFVTNPPVFIGNPLAKFYWLKHWSFIRDESDFVQCTDKTLIDADILIDDNVQNVWSFTNDYKTGFVYSQPWNRDFVYPHRIQNWAHFLEEVAYGSSAISFSRDLR